MKNSLKVTNLKVVCRICYPTVFENNCANGKVRSLSGTSDPPLACLLSHVTTCNRSRKQTDIHHINIGKKGLRIQQE